VRSVPDALDAVRGGAADAALVPMENSIGGQVSLILDELVNGAPLVIIRDVVLPVQFVLAAAGSRPLESIRRVAAHPQANIQCRRWLRAHLPSAEINEVLSNAAAAQAAAAGEYDAAVCAPFGPAQYGLTVLAKEIADRSDAHTRFVLVSRPGPPPPPTGDDLTSLAVTIAHDRVGALLSVLTELAVRGVNLTRIESRPTGERLGRYLFFLDCAGHVAESRLGEALRGLRRVCPDVRFLGSYPRTHAGGADQADQASLTAPPAGLSEEDFSAASAWLSRLRAGQVA